MEEKMNKETIVFNGISRKIKYQWINMTKIESHLKNIKVFEKLKEIVHVHELPESSLSQWLSNQNYFIDSTQFPYKFR